MLAFPGIVPQKPLEIPLRAIFCSLLALYQSFELWDGLMAQCRMFWSILVNLRGDCETLAPFCAFSGVGKWTEPVGPGTAEPRAKGRFRPKMTKIKKKNNFFGDAPNRLRC